MTEPQYMGSSMCISQYNTDDLQGHNHKVDDL